VSNSQTLQVPQPFGPAKQGRMLEVGGDSDTNYNKSNFGRGSSLI